jgi:hypothetical protein
MSSVASACSIARPAVKPALGDDRVELLVDLVELALEQLAPLGSKDLDRLVVRLRPFTRFAVDREATTDLVAKPEQPVQRGVEQQPLLPDVELEHRPHDDLRLDEQLRVGERDHRLHVPPLLGPVLPRPAGAWRPASVRCRSAAAGRACGQPAPLTRSRARAPGALVDFVLRTKASRGR